MTVVPMKVVIVQLGFITAAFLSGERGLNIINVCIILEREGVGE